MWCPSHITICYHNYQLIKKKNRQWYFVVSLGSCVQLVVIPLTFFSHQVDKGVADSDEAKDNVFKFLFRLALVATVFLCSSERPTGKANVVTCCSACLGFVTFTHNVVKFKSQRKTVES